jgi:hypothetical protein
MTTVGEQDRDPRLDEHTLRDGRSFAASVLDRLGGKGTTRTHALHGSERGLLRREREMPLQRGAVACDPHHRAIVDTRNPAPGLIAHSVDTPLPLFLLETAAISVVGRLRLGGSARNPTLPIPGGAVPPRQRDQHMPQMKLQAESQPRLHAAPLHLLFTQAEQH